MNPEENDFRDLRQLLALKRHEQPPPGYFYHFSGHVIARIKAGETGREEGIFERWLAGNDWLARIWAMVQGQPALAGAMGVVACGVLMGGLLLSDPAQGSASLADSSGKIMVFSTVAAPVGFSQRARFENYSRTNGLTIRQLHSSLFEEPRHSNVQFVNSLAPAGFQ
jgi:hypothetical protein